MILDRLPRPLIIAHRGASACAPENTLAAFELAVEQGADAVELDAKLTRDGEVVVIHDNSCERTTNGKGRVRDLTLAELKQLDAGAWFGPQFAGECIPTLREVLLMLKDRAAVNIELTNYAAPKDGLVERVISVVQECGVSGQVFFSSFSTNNIRTARRLLPEVPCGVLAITGAAWPVFFISAFMKYESFNPELRDATPRLINAAHRRGKRVFVYTVVDPADMRRLIDSGADGLFVNDPLAGLAAAGGKP